MNGTNTQDAASTSARPAAVCGLVSQKITTWHRERLALVYVRQSTMQQVLLNRESTARQYALAEHAETLGWPGPRVLTIDEDQGCSGRRADNRSGFQRLLSEVTMDHVGIVLGLEMSRLARSSKDWHHLIEVCAVFGTLLGDQDGVYDPRDANDRLLLGLKATMSEVELHTLRSRLERGKLSKAQRGELFLSVPTGYVRLPDGTVELDPDEQVRAVIGLLFDKFAELGSVHALFRYLIQHDIRLGRRSRRRGEQGQLHWRPARLSALYAILHHPIYAGAYAYGRRPTDPRRQFGKVGRPAQRWLPMEQWKVLRRDQLPAYIPWEQYLHNQERLKQNLQRAETLGVARRGEALLCGLVCCGRCGGKLQVVYPGHKPAHYACVSHRRAGIGQTCAGVRAAVLDAVVAEQVLKALEPAALELSLRAAEQLQQERDRQEEHWRLQLERARYEVERAERQYQAVEPENRLVAASLEKRWEEALRQQQQLEEEYHRANRKTAAQWSAAERQRISALATDMPALWRAADAAHRKEIIRCLVERVVASVQDDSEQVEVRIDWQGGWVSRHAILRPVRTYAQLSDFEQLCTRVVQLHEAGYTAVAIADTLNREGFRPPKQRENFTGPMIRQLMHRERMILPAQPAENEWRLRDLANKLGMPATTVHSWIGKGWIHARKAHGVWLLWADRKELNRLRRLARYKQRHACESYPTDLKTPAPRTPDNH